jgi:hypothetical protein
MPTYTAFLIRTRYFLAIPDRDPLLYEWTRSGYFHLNLKVLCALKLKLAKLYFSTLALKHRLISTEFKDKKLYLGSWRPQKKKKKRILIPYLPNRYRTVRIRNTIITVRTVPVSLMLFGDKQCCGSGSVGYKYFWTSRIQTQNSKI